MYCVTAQSKVRVQSVLNPGGALNEITLADSYSVTGFAVHPTTGHLYYDYDVYLYKFNGSSWTVFAGTGIASNGGDGGPILEAEFAEMSGISFNKNGSILFIADTGSSKVRYINMQTEYVYLLADFSPARPTSVAVDSWDRVYVSVQNQVYSVNSTGGYSLFYSMPANGFVSGMTFDHSYRFLFILDSSVSILTRVRFSCDSAVISNKCVISNKKLSSCSAFSCAF